VIDLQQIENNKNTQLLNFDKISEYSNLHYVDALLEVIPKKNRHRRLILKESLKGFEELKGFVSKPNSNFDVVIYPFSEKNEFSWTLDDFYLFISYFFSMNPGKK